MVAGVLVLLYLLTFPTNAGVAVAVRADRTEHCDLGTNWGPIGM
jgi:hypothetical protein